MDKQCEDCNLRTQGGCEKHPVKICPVRNCDKKCGAMVHGTLKRKSLILPRINFLFKPRRNIKDGLLVLWDETTDTSTAVSLADIAKGQREYEMPTDLRTIKGVYMKIR